MVPSLKENSGDKSPDDEMGVDINSVPVAVASGVCDDHW